MNDLKLSEEIEIKFRALETELDLLRNIHHQARCLMRYNGIDKTRADNAYDAMKGAVYAVNDFNENNG